MPAQQGRGAPKQCFLGSLGSGDKPGFRLEFAGPRAGGEGAPEREGCPWILAEDGPARGCEDPAWQVSPSWSWLSQATGKTATQAQLSSPITQDSSRRKKVGNPRALEHRKCGSPGGGVLNEERVLCLRSLAG